MSMQRVITSLKLALVALIMPIATMAQEFNESLLPTVELSGFDAIQIDGKVEVELIPIGDENSPRIVYDLDDNDPERFTFEINDAGLLMVKHKYSNRNIGVVQARIYYSDIKSINVKGAKITFASVLDRKDRTFDLTMGDGATLSGEINCIDINAVVSSQSVLSMSGECMFMTINASNKSKLELRNIEVLSAEIQSTSGATVALTAGKRLIASATSNGVVKYWGEPMILRSKASLNGVVLKAE